MEFNQMNIQGEDYSVIDVYNNSITLPDSFAAQCNKFGKGHGEAKLYVGTKTQMNAFFGKDVNCFVLKNDFINYRNSLQSAKTVLSAIYKKSKSNNKSFISILNFIDNLINNMKEKETFTVKLKNELKGNRGYINSITNSKSNGYYFLRACCIPFVSFIRILKLQHKKTGHICFYIKLFPSFDEMYQQIQYIKKYGKRTSVNYGSTRNGQNKYKKELIELFDKCPFTQMEDERLLIASHIQPFASCNKQQKYDIDNGLLLSPLYDKLFDRGFITFNQQGVLRKTIWLSQKEWEKIPLDYSILDLHLTPQRKEYMKFHEEHVFLGD